MNAWWNISVCINRSLCGGRSEPLCSRVYRQPPSRWRSTFMALMDRAFAETAHCENIHLRWRAQANPQGDYFAPEAADSLRSSSSSAARVVS